MRKILRKIFKKTGTINPQFTTEEAEAIKKTLDTMFPTSMVKGMVMTMMVLNIPDEKAKKIKPVDFLVLDASMMSVANLVKSYKNKRQDYDHYKKNYILTVAESLYLAGINTTAEEDWMMAEKMCVGVIKAIEAVVNLSEQKCQPK